jgi:hypothetical protein
MPPTAVARARTHPFLRAYSTPRTPLFPLPPSPSPSSRPRRYALRLALHDPIDHTRAATRFAKKSRALTIRAPLAPSATAAVRADLVGDGAADAEAAAAADSTAARLASETAEVARIARLLKRARCARRSNPPTGRSGAEGILQGTLTSVRGRVARAGDAGSGGYKPLCCSWVATAAPDCARTTRPHAREHARTHARTCKHARTHANMHARTDTKACAPERANACMHACMHYKAHRRARTHRYTHACMQTCTHART